MKYGSDKQDGKQNMAAGDTAASRRVTAATQWLAGLTMLWA